LREWDEGNQFLSGLLERFRAPPDLGPFCEEDAEEVNAEEDAAEDAELDDDICISFRSWWRRGASLGGAFGLLLGGLVYLLVASVDARSVQAIGASAQTAAGSALLSLGSEVPSDTTRNMPAVRIMNNDPADSASSKSMIRPDSKPIVAPEPAIVPIRRDVSMHSSRRSSKRNTKARSPKMATEYRKLLRKGWSHYHKRSFQSSSVAFSRAVHLAPHLTGGYSGLALSLFEQGAEDGAMQVLERGVKKVGPKADLWILAGSIYQFKGKQRLARMAYRRYLRAHPRGKYVRDVRVILAYEELPSLIPFADESEQTALAGQ
jgi:tetratricopeptide (TPR) repeat protein